MLERNTSLMQNEVLVVFNNFTWVISLKISHSSIQFHIHIDELYLLFFQIVKNVDTLNYCTFLKIGFKKARKFILNVARGIPTSTTK